MSTEEGELDETDYGSLSQNLIDHGNTPFYLTTAIAYTNGLPHIGHAYEFLSADSLVRFHRVLGLDCFFLTGTDEHGQKVANSAEAANISPQAHCDKYFHAFQRLHRRLKVSYSSFVRTTHSHHMRTSQSLWRRCAAAGDIYLSSYEGWYSEREEVFVSDADAEAAGFKDVGSGLPLKRVTEESYFFRMSNYLDRLVQWIEVDKPDFIQPDLHKQNILGRLKKEGLRDLSISRTSFSWGIPVPEEFDQKHVMYVWFDALSNYLSGVHALDADSDGEEVHEFSRYWPAQTHLIGKDIVWFHTVIWPCMLMSASLPLPQTVFCHGFVNASDGRKMSKSYNNTIDPDQILDKYSSDSLRYYMSSSVTFGSDLNFSEESLVTMHNSELADVLGNLVHRVLTLCLKYCDGLVPDCKHDPLLPLPFDLSALKEGVRSDMKDSCINAALFRAMEAVRSTNRFLTEAEPWKMKGSEESRRVPVVRTALEAVYAFSHFLAPVIPSSMQSVFDKLGTPPVSVPNLKDDLYNLRPGTRVTLGDILFQKIETEEQKIVLPTTQVKPAKKAAVVQQSEEQQQQQQQSDFSKVDIRVGLVVKVWNHATAERLFCEEVDLGHGEIRQIASGLRQHYSLESLQGRKVLVVCNLKESKFQGFMSYGMVLAAKSEDGSRVELVDPPVDSVIGERVTLLSQEEMQQEPWNAAKMKKGKVWESVSSCLKSDEEGFVCWQETPLTTSKGICRVASLVKSCVS